MTRAAWLAIPLGLVACSSQVAPVSTTRIAIAVAPLNLPGIDFACYDLLIENEDGETVVALGNPAASLLSAAPDDDAICSTQFGNGAGGDISYVAPCDASRPAHTVTLWVDGLYSGTPLAPTGVAYQDPCPGGCQLAVACAENADTSVVFDLTIMRPANQGFFDVAVNFDDIFCSAKVDCAYAGGEPIATLFEPDGVSRGQTAILALACTSGPGVDGASPNDTVLFRNPIVINCGGDEITLDPTAGPGNVYTDTLPDPDPADAVWQYATYFGNEQLPCGAGSCNKRYWNVAVGFDPSTPDCTLTTSATAAAGALVDDLTPSNTTYPWIDVDVRLTNATGGGLACSQHPLNGAPAGVSTRYTPVDDAMLFCHSYDGSAPQTSTLSGPDGAICPTPFMPLGVYWPGEETFANEPDRWARIEGELSQLHDDGINTIWLTHLTSTETAQFSRLAARYEIRVVAAVAQIDGSECGVLFGLHGVRDAATGRCSSVDPDFRSEYQPLIEGVLTAWGDAPKPLAWGLGDEPLTINADEFEGYVDAWRTHAPGAPLTTVLMWGDWDRYVTMGFDSLTTDIYPFFRGPGYPTTPSHAYELLSRKSVRTHPSSWMMGQAFSDPNLAFPSPEQLSWQAWTALASGMKGFFAFVYRGPASCVEPCALIDETSGTATLTPQYVALARAYKALGALSPILLGAARDPSVFATIDRPGRDSSLAVGLSNPATGKKHLVVVAGYESAGDRTLEVTIGPDITALRRVSDGVSIPLTTSAGMRKATITLAAGTGELYECTVDPANAPAVYFDDFSSDKFSSDTTFHNVARFDYLLNGKVLSATVAEDWPADFLQIDLDARLGSLTPDGLRVLNYDGYVVSDSGVRWYSSDDDTNGFSTVSQNQFDAVTRLTGRYLKGSISWARASSIDYAFLTEFRLLQWPFKAE